MFAVDKGKTYVFSNNEWKDGDGRPITVSIEDEQEMSKYIAGMEEAAYRGRGYVMLGGYDTVQEMLEDYLEADIDDTFLVFRLGSSSGEITVKPEPIEPVRRPGQTEEQFQKAHAHWLERKNRNRLIYNKKYAGSVYMMASKQHVYIPSRNGRQAVPIEVAYVADLNGDIIGGGKLEYLLGIFMKWLDMNGVNAFSGDCMQTSSDKLLNTPVIRKLLSENGFVDADGLNELESQTTRIFVRNVFWDGLSDNQKKDLKSYMNEIQ